MDEKTVKERAIDRFLNYEIKAGSMSIPAIDLVYVMCLWVLGFLIRKALFPIESADYYGFLAEWMDKIRENGNFRSLKMQISNYTSPYMYLMCLVAVITENSLYGLKMISVVFDYAASVAIFLLVRELTGSRKRAILGMSILLLSPTVILDSAYWCQCDIIYTTFILFALYAFFRNNSRACFILLGIGFSFKLQTLFILPFLVIMYLCRKKIDPKHILYLPVIYVVMQFPAWMFGRDFKELMTIYLDQSGYYPWGTLEYPNFYAFLDEVIPNGHHMDEVGKAGVFLTLMFLGFLAYYIYTKKVELDEDLCVTIALFSVAMIVYSLPHMHDRYGFLIDLLAIVYALMRPGKRLIIMCGFFLTSIFTFMPYLIAVHIFSLQTVALMQLLLITCVGTGMLIRLNQAPAVKPFEPAAPVVGEGDTGNDGEEQEEEENNNPEINADELL